MVNGKYAATKPDNTPRFHLRSVTSPGCVLALLLLPGVAIAQNTPLPEAPAQTASPASEKPSAAPPKISFAAGQLTIDAHDATLAEILEKVAALTGVHIDLPAGAGTEKMPVVELGPGPARHVLGSLLSDSGFDYLIQASAADPERLQSVLLMPREKKGSGTNSTDAAAGTPRSAYARASAPPPPAPSEPAPVPDNPTPTQPDNTATDAIALNPPSPSTQPELSNSLRPGALAPPQSLTPQSINLQLQQMYQQRMQMIQQDRPTSPTTVPANPAR